MMQDGAPLIPLLDLAALAWFLASWTGYVAYTKRCSLSRKRGLLAAMNRTRARWAEALARRENRVADAQMMNGMVRKDTFFASTTLLLLASTLALPGMSDQVNPLFSQVPYARHSSLALWELKVAVLLLTFVYAFFKFTWAIRQHTFCAVLVVAVPMPGDADATEVERDVTRLSRLSNLAARHFNDGVRAYYFALAVLSWFYHPVALLMATAWVIAVLYRREFHSTTLAILE